MRGLPAHGGKEITEEVMEGLQRVVRDKRDHQLHARVPVHVRLPPEKWNFPKMGYYHIFFILFNHTGQIWKNLISCS
jgi:hypothetical protein